MGDTQYAESEDHAGYGKTDGLSLKLGSRISLLLDLGPRYMGSGDGQEHGDGVLPCSQRIEAQPLLTHNPENQAHQELNIHDNRRRHAQTLVPCSPRATPNPSIERAQYRDGEDQDDDVSPTRMRLDQHIVH